jgi:hypothetical protein
MVVKTRLDTNDVEGFELVTNGLHRLSPDTVEEGVCNAMNLPLAGA